MLQTAWTVPVTDVRARRLTSVLGGLDRQVLAVERDGPPGASGPGTERRSPVPRHGLRALPGKVVGLQTMPPPDRGKLVSG